ncbi:unnamed protein product, partial [Ixodes pacificus]
QCFNLFYFVFCIFFIYITQVTRLTWPPAGIIHHEEGRTSDSLLEKCSVGLDLTGNGHVHKFISYADQHASEDVGIHLKFENKERSSEPSTAQTMFCTKTITWHIPTGSVQRTVPT